MTLFFYDTYEKIILLILMIDGMTQVTDKNKKEPHFLVDIDG